MTAHRLILIAAGAVAVALIAAAMMLGRDAGASGFALLAMLLGTYALGLALGRLGFNRD